MGEFYVNEDSLGRLKLSLNDFDYLFFCTVPRINQRHTCF